jgi:CheY-like chemotaxis protein
LDSTLNRQLKTILIVDDQTDCRITIKLFFSNFGYTVDTARNAGEALSLFDARLHDLVVTDNSMPGMSGQEMAHVLKMRSPSTPIIMYTGLVPENQSCLDLVIQRPAHLLIVKEAVDKMLGVQYQAPDGS